MVTVNPGSSFPEQEYAQLDRNAVEQLVLGIDSESIREQLESAEDIDELALLPIAELIIKLLVEKTELEAALVTNKFLQVIIDSNSVFSGTIWQNVLFTVIPSAVVLEKFDYLNEFIENELADPVARSGMLAVAAHVCLSKHHYERAKTYLQKAKQAVASDPLVSTFSIDELIAYADAQLSGDNEHTHAGHSHAHSHEVHSHAGNFKNVDACVVDQASLSSGTEQVLRKWQLKLGAKEQDAPWTSKDDLAFFFQRFRPDGEGIAEFCSDMNCDAIAPRLIEMFRATANSYKSGNSVDPYFVVRDVPSSSEEELKPLALAYIESLKRISPRCEDNEADEDEFVSMESYFELSPIIEIARGEKAPLESSDIEISVYLALNDYFAACKISKEASLLTEALYTMANNYNLSHYVLWPMLQETLDKTLEDPYSKYFELWRRGVNPFFEDDHKCVLYTVS